MFSIACNIDKTDRINRVVFGALIFLGALVGLGKIFFMLVGIILVAEGLIGWCGIPLLVEKLKKLK